jgi:hypothetical protein
MGGERRGAPTKARAAIRKLETVTRGCEAKSLNCLYWPQYLPQAILGWEGRVNGSRKQPYFSPIWNTGK